MRIESFNKDGGIIEVKELDYETGVWKTYDGEGNLKSQYQMTEPEIEEFNSNQKKLRENEFRNEADPLFFKVQAGEEPLQNWIDKRAEIRDRNKYIKK